MAYKSSSYETRYGLNLQVYYSEVTHVLPVDDIEGRCEVRKKNDLPLCNVLGIFQHIFFCEHLYDPSKGSLKQVVICSIKC